MNKKIDVRSEFILDDQSVMKRKFNVVLALNIFPQFLNTVESYNQFLVFLKKLKTNYMILHTHPLGEHEIDGVYRNLKPKEFCEFVAQETGMKRTKCIYQNSDGHPVYLLKK